MKGLTPLFLGIFGTFAFSWIGLTVIPTWQIGHLNPESDEEGTDIYPRPQSGMSSGARTFMQRMAASIAIANKSAPIISQTISNENGGIAAAHRAITFLIVRYSSGKCEWVRTLQISVRVHPHQRNLQRLLRKGRRLPRLQRKQRHFRPRLR